MKKIALLFFPFIACLLHGCERDIDMFRINEAVPPVLNVTPASTLSLSEETAEDTVLRLDWSPTQYLDETVGGSVIGSYTLQMDITPQFENPYEIVTDNGRKLRFTGKQFNTLLLNNLELPPEQEQHLYVRVKSVFFDSDISYSQTVDITVTPYNVYVPPAIEVPAALYLASGDAVPGGWMAPIPDSRKFSQVSETKFTLTVTLVANKSYDLITDVAAVNYTPVFRLGPGVNPAAMVYGGTFVADGDGYPLNWTSQSLRTPPNDGVYVLTFDFQTATFTVAAP